MKTSQHILNTTMTIASMMILSGFNYAAKAHEVPTIPQDFFSIQNSAREFFEDGQEQLEQEIKILNRRGTIAEGLLNINEDVLPPQQEQLFEMPDGLLEEKLKELSMWEKAS